MTTNQEPERPVFYNDFDIKCYPQKNGYDFDSLDGRLNVEARKISQNGQGKVAELSFFCDNPESHNQDDAIIAILSNVRLHLQNPKDRDDLALRLANTQSAPWALPWNRIIEKICREIIDYESTSSPIEDIDTEPIIRTFESEIEGLCIPKKTHTTIFSPGGKGKSNLALYFAVLKTYGVAPGNLPFIPCPGNVLYLDGESSAEILRVYVNAIKRGLGIDTELNRKIYYQSLDGKNIFDIADELRQTIQERDIDLLIIDSQMAATAGGPQYQGEAERASAYYNILNSFGCTTLTIDHVTKSNMQGDNNTGTAFGSVVKYNRARSQYELRSQQDTDNSHLELALIHTKYNLGVKQKPLGIAIDFISNTAGELESIEVSPCDLAGNPELEKSLPNYTRIKNAIFDNGGQATPAEIAGLTGLSGDSVSMTLSHYKKIFTQVNKQNHTWGVLEND